MSNVIDFKKKVKELKPPTGGKYVLVYIDDMAEDAFVEVSEQIDNYQAIGILEWGKSVILAGDDLTKG